MRKLIIALLLTSICAGLAIAATDDTGEIKVTCQREVSVVITTTTNMADQGGTAQVDLGTVQTGTTCKGAYFIVWNNSPSTAASIQNYSAYVTAATGLNNATGVWDTNAVNEYMIAAAFINDTSDGSGMTLTSADVPGEGVGNLITWVGGTILSPGAGADDYEAGEGETAHVRNSLLTDHDLRLGVHVQTPLAVTASAAAEKTFTLTLVAEQFTGNMLIQRLTS